MKELKCPNCGAPINRATMHCDYCGASFEYESGMIIRQIEHPKILPINTAMKVDKDFVVMGGYEKFIVDHVAYQLAEQVAKFMEVTIQDDPATDQVTAYGRVRLIPPGVKF